MSKCRYLTLEPPWSGRSIGTSDKAILRRTQPYGQHSEHSEYIIKLIPGMQLVFSLLFYILRIIIRLSILNIRLLISRDIVYSYQYQQTAIVTPGPLIRRIISLIAPIHLLYIIKGCSFMSRLYKVAVSQSCSNGCMTHK